MTKNEILSVLNEKGWIYFESFGNFYEFAHDLGIPVPTRRGGQIISELKILRKEEAPLKSLSRLHGFGAFPYHTDGAHKKEIPKYLLMRIKHGTVSNRPTLIKDIQENLKENEIRILSYDLWYVRDGRKTFLRPIYQKKKGDGATLRYDTGCMVPANNEKNQSKYQISEILERTKTETVNWRQNYWLLLDNSRVLHSRSENLSIKSPENRTLERILINKVNL